MKKLPNRSQAALAGTGTAKAPRKRRTVPTGKTAADRREAKAGAKPMAQVDDIRDAVTRLKREHILSVAADLFYSNGFGNTTLEQVAERMNVTKPFIYSHFRSKSELLAEICSRGVRASLDVMNRVVSIGGTPTAQMRVLLHDLMMSVLEHQKHVGIWFREEKYLDEAAIERIGSMRREFDAKVRDILHAGVKTGEFKVPDLEMASLAIGGMAIWSHVWYRPNGRLSREEIARYMADLTVAMIQARDGPLVSA